LAQAPAQPPPKGVRFISGSRKELVALGAVVAKSFGHSIHEAQRHLTPLASKPLPQFGPRVFELIKDFQTDAFRCNIYVSKYFVYVLVPYKKRSKTGKGIPKELIDLTSSRLGVAKELEKQEH
jgi:phage-related protein